MNEEKLEQILSKLTSIDGRMSSMEEKVTSMDGRMSSTEEKVTTIDERMNGMNKNIEELKTGQKVLTDGQRGLRKEINTRFNETKERFDFVDRQLRLLDVDFSGIEEKMKHHDRDIHCLKNL
ncbi:hypothetical protein [Salicibibacter kimchii]|uniref:t-SNARE coiled-coil homology domain-containing protein n=1 Tax=Salicibibacter kimchii TaxID=2099786 RepID=A0A345BYS1_9BACI|nr:hypothetical protein [Salicibibacter kimchii]AXF56102.1 hypothetical protein DT065_08745 [Salicibibacter kimchii]